MIDINLLPEQLRKRKKRMAVKAPGKFLKAKLLPFAIGGAGLIILLQLALFSVALVSKGKISSLQEKEKALGPNKKIVDALKEEEKLLGAKSYYIDEFQKKRVLWSKKLNDLSDCVTSGVWLASLYIEKTTITQPAAPGQKAKKYNVYSLSISGKAVSSEGDETALIGKFVKSLKENKSFCADFDEVTLVSSKRVKIKILDVTGVIRIEVMEFVLSCPFKGKEEVL